MEKIDTYRNTRSKPTCALGCDVIHKCWLSLHAYHDRKEGDNATCLDNLETMVARISNADSEKGYCEDWPKDAGDDLNAKPCMRPCRRCGM